VIDFSPVSVQFLLHVKTSHFEIILVGTFIWILKENLGMLQS